MAICRHGRRLAASANQPVGWDRARAGSCPDGARIPGTVPSTRETTLSVPQWRAVSRVRSTVGLQGDAVLGSSFKRLIDYTSANRVDKYFLVYLVWLLAAAAWVWTLLISPQAMAGMLDVLGVHRFTISAIQRFGFVLLGLAWLVATLWTEHYLRTSVSKQRVVRSVVRVVIATIIVFIVTTLVQLSPVLVQLI